MGGMFAGGGDVCRWGTRTTTLSNTATLVCWTFRQDESFARFWMFVHGTGQRGRFILLDFSLNVASRLVFRRTRFLYTFVFSLVAVRVVPVFLVVFCLLLLRPMVSIAFFSNDYLL